ncbi:MAG: hypothetical protein H0V18_20965, partial [Pyrinomonadaceae bacterium]|nr:hypothetical protein [Pyrinomonadaceae bacterium]
AQAGVEVRASLASGEGTLGGQTNVLTDGQGRAAYADLAIVGGPGARTLQFASTSPASAVLSATVTLPSVAAASIRTAPAGPVVVGTRLVTPITWVLTDAANQPVADAPIVIAVSAGGSVESAGVSDPGGVVQLISWTVSQTAGSQFVDLEVGGAAVSRVSVGAIPDVAFRLEKTSGDGQSAPVNADLPLPLVVRVLDQYGNGVTGVTIEWRTCDGVGEYNSLTDIGGYASAFQPTGPAAGDFCAMASSSGLAGSPAQFSYSVQPGPAPVSSAPSGVLRAIPPTSARPHSRP